MNYFPWQISVVAVLPALFLCGFIYYKDKIEKEPLPLLLLLFGLGAAAYYPISLLQKAVFLGVDGVFEAFITHSADGSVEYANAFAMVAHKFTSAFFGIALFEVLAKWGVLFCATHKNKHFNYLFDGIVYSVFISLGYAAFENIRFAIVNGWDTLVLHSLSSVPSHLMVGIAMGYFYTLWNAHRRARELEERCVRKGFLTSAEMKSPWKRLLLSVAVPFFISGAYLFAAQLDVRWFSTLLYFLIFMMYGFSFITVDRIAAKDGMQNKYSKMLLCEKHPELDTNCLEAYLSDETEGGAEQ